MRQIFWSKSIAVAAQRRSSVHVCVCARGLGAAYRFEWFPPAKIHLVSSLGWEMSSTHIRIQINKEKPCVYACARSPSMCTRNTNIYIYTVCSPRINSTVTSLIYTNKLSVGDHCRVLYLQSADFSRKLIPVQHCQPLSCAVWEYCKCCITVTVTTQECNWIKKLYKCAEWMNNLLFWQSVAFPKTILSPRSRSDISLYGMNKQS